MGLAVLGFTGRENTAKNQRENTVKKIRKRYRLGTLAAVIFLPVCALLANGMPGASAASTAAQPTSSAMTTVKFADSAVASAATRSAPPHGHPRHVARDAALCKYVLNSAGYVINLRMTLGCNAGAIGYPGRPDVSEAIAIAVCSGFLLAARVDKATTAAACFAANPLQVIVSTQLCEANPYYSDCPNAWGGGPWVKDYTGGPELSDTNQDFMVIDENGSQTGPSEIMFYGNSSWSGQCIGDAYNNSGRADVSLDPCGLPGQAQAGWGTQMTWGTSGCPSGEAWFHDSHWNGYLGPGSSVNGSPFYLNKPSPVCFSFVELVQ